MTATFDSVRVTRQTAETTFEIILRPRTRPTTPLLLPNRLLSHFLDHFAKAAGITVELVRTDWPGSWSFDHVLCEDLGQLIGRGLLGIHNQLAAKQGVAGRASTSCCMDDAHVDLTISIEGRPSVSWDIPNNADIDGFVDLWYDQRGGAQGTAYGTNLRQFVDGFSFGSGATLAINARRTGNLHHLYEVLFRALGDAVGTAIGTANASRLPGDTSGLAGSIEYTVTKTEPENETS